MKKTTLLIGILALSVPLAIQAERYTGTRYSDPNSDFNRINRDMDRNAYRRDTLNRLDQIERNTRPDPYTKYPPDDFLNQPLWTPKGYK